MDFRKSCTAVSQHLWRVDHVRHHALRMRRVSVYNSRNRLHVSEPVSFMSEHSSIVETSMVRDTCKGSMGPGARRL